MGDAGYTIVDLFSEEQVLKFGMTAHLRFYAAQTGPGDMVIASSTGTSTNLGLVQPERVAAWTYEGLPSDAAVTITLTPQIVDNGTVTHSGQAIPITWGPNANGTADSFWNANAHGTNARFSVPAADATTGTVTEYLGAFGYATACFNAEYFVQSLSGSLFVDWTSVSGWGTSDTMSVDLNTAWSADGPYKLMMTGYSADASRTSNCSDCGNEASCWEYQSKACQPTWVFNAPANPYGPTLVSLGDTLTLTNLPVLSPQPSVYFSYVGSNADDLIKQQSIVPVNGSISIPCNRMGAIWINVPTSNGNVPYYCNVQQ